MANIRVRVAGPFEVLGHEPDDVFEIDVPVVDEDDTPAEADQKREQAERIRLLFEAGHLALDPPKRNRS